MERGGITILYAEIKGVVSSDGYEYLEHPTGSDAWFIRDQSSGQWDEWKQ